LTRAYHHLVALWRRLIELQPQSSGRYIANDGFLRAARLSSPNKGNLYHPVALISWVSAFFEHILRIVPSDESLKKVSSGSWPYFL
jgi:hypothetical protein